MRLRTFTFVPITTPRQANHFHLVMDIAWFGLGLTTITRFLSLFAIRLGSDATFLAILTALPSLIMTVGSLFSLWWRKRYPDSVHALIIPMGWRIQFLMLASTPLLPQTYQPLWMVIAVTITAIPRGVVGVLFLVLMRETLEQDDVATVMSRRVLALNVTVMMGTVVSGLLLEYIAFPLNYQIMYLFAFATSLFSMWHVLQLQPQRNFQINGKGLLNSTLWRSRELRSMVMTISLTHIAFFSVFPLLPLFLVDNLGGDEGFVAIFGLFELAGGICVAIITTRIIRRLGSHRLIALAMLSTATSAATVALAPDLWLTLPAAILLGAGWAAVDVGLVSTLIRESPSDQTIEFSTIFMQIVGFSAFVGPFIGSALVELGLDLQSVLLVGAGLRLVASIVISPTIFSFSRYVPTLTTRH